MILTKSLPEFLFKIKKKMKSQHFEVSSQKTGKEAAAIELISKRRFEISSSFKPHVAAFRKAEHVRFANRHQMLTAEELLNLLMSRISEIGNAECGLLEKVSIPKSQFRIPFTHTPTCVSRGHLSRAGTFAVYCRNPPRGTHIPVSLPG